MQRVEEPRVGVTAAVGVDVRFALGRARITVRTPDATVAGDVAGLFRPLVVAMAAPQGRAGLTIGGGNSAWTLRSTLPSGGARTRRFRKRPSLLAATEFALLEHLLRGISHDAHLHASATVVEGRAVVAVGASRAGKSSLALGWSLGGHPLLTDEVVRVDARGFARGVPRLVKAGRRLLRAHGLKEEDTLAPDPRLPDLWWDPERGCGWSEGSYPVGVVARVGFASRSPTRVRRLPPAGGLRALLDSLLDSGLQAAEGLDRLARIAEHAALVDVRFGSGASAAAELVALARAGR